MEVRGTTGTGQYPSLRLGRQYTDISDKDFHRLSNLFRSTCGINLPHAKRTMLQTRLMPRVKTLALSSFDEYCDFLFSEEGARLELTHAIDAITTNKTEFFRESRHLKYLADVILPRLAEERDVGFRRPLRIWSAGCSTGEEPYSITMVLNEFRRKYPDFDYVLLATDISTKALDKARLGIYSEGEARPIPDELKRQYLRKSIDKKRRLVRIVPELRRKVVFVHKNLMDEDYRLPHHMDIIFFRNVLIYFERVTQHALIQKVCNHLNSGGHIFVGHAESLSGSGVSVNQIAPTAYRKYHGNAMRNAANISFSNKNGLYFGRRSAATTEM